VYTFGKICPKVHSVLNPTANIGTILIRTKLTMSQVIVLVLIVAMNLLLFPAARCRGLSIGSINKFYHTGIGNEKNIDSSLFPVSHDDNFREAVSKLLCRGSRSYRRLCHLEYMAADSTSRTMISSAGRGNNIADIGTDHGLLAIGLSLTGLYGKVIGVDLSDQALKNGALALLRQVQNRMVNANDNYYGKRMDVEFRLGDGLLALKDDEADIICMAGMGVNTMIQILEKNTTTVDHNSTHLERVGCKRLVLQPTNSRPRNLILLYDWLQKKGWKIRDERIEKISSRWYMTTSFELTKNNLSAVRSLELPGCKLMCLDESYSMRQVFDEYCQHHESWIKQDESVSGRKIECRDSRWLEYFFDNSSATNSSFLVDK